MLEPLAAAAVLFAPAAVLFAPAAALACAEHAEGEACGHDHAKAEAKAQSKAHAKPPAPAPLHLGEKFTNAPSVKLADVVQKPEQLTGKPVTVEATVRKACTNKGCWMELADGADAKASAVRVTFKNYGFFVPLDSAGSTAKVEGQFKVAELSEAKAKHWEGEGATVPRGADGKPREVQLVATAVELRRPL